jgi:hypothetical protein
MTTHNIAITYPPKIEPVWCGVIRQTIRPYSAAKPKRVGDIANLFAWTGRPYRSPWAWHKREVIIAVLEVRVSHDCFTLYWPGSRSATDYDWHSSYVERLAQMDGIVPPTGPVLHDVLLAFHPKIGSKGLHMQVIRW